VLLAASAGFTVVVLDTTVANVALPSIGRDLHASIAGLQWVIDTYVAAFSALLLSGVTPGRAWGRAITSRCGLSRPAAACAVCK
jgi:DHA2 family methylenomycin A resistance protein-like MFS transporter